MTGALERILGLGATRLLGRNNLGYYAGSLDEVRVYARALSATEIASLAAL
jgi:hypothetical protein